MRDVQWIVVHTAGAANAQGQPVYQTVKQIHDYHVQHNGWRKGGYHAFVQKDGYLSRNPEYTRTDEEVGAHAGGFNEHSLGICCAGHGDLVDFTPMQKMSLVDQCVLWLRKYKWGAERVVGHRETSLHGGPEVYKTCPGLKVNMVDLRRMIELELLR